MSILIKNGIIITLGDDNKVLYNHHLSLKNGKVDAILSELPDEKNYEKVINAKGKIVLPGFINAHMHFYSTLVRGLGKAEPAHNFQEVLENLWWRLDKKLNKEDVYYSALLMLIHSIRSGTTTLIDHHASPGFVKGSLNEIAKAVKETGLRASLCYELSDRDGEKVTQEGLEENEDFLKNYGANQDEHLKALFGLHASFTVSNNSLEKAVDIAKKYDGGFHVHVAEAASDQTSTKDQFGLSVVRRFQKFGVLGPKSIAAHCIHLDDEEMDILADTRTQVVHNPQSNMNNAVGIADISKMTQKGIRVGLGTDAMTVNMLEEVRVALWAQHLLHKDPSVGFMEAASTLFFNNAKIANTYWNTPLGSLEVGASADVILMEYDPPTPMDENTLLGHLIFGISQHKVDTTIAGGKVLMENGILKLNLDEAGIAAKARELTEKLWERF